MEKDNIEIKTINIGLLGDTCAGKTAICDTFLGNEYDTRFTLGFDKLDTKYKLENGKEIKVILWDTAGAERYRSTVFKTLRAAQGLALVFDVTSKVSFDEIDNWLDEIRENLPNSNHILVLLGNKMDMENKRKVTKEEIEFFAKKKNLVYYETSAKINKGINESFKYLINSIYDKELEKKYYEVFKKFFKESGKGVEECLFNENKKLKKIKELKDELNYCKTEIGKLKKDYDTLNKNYDKLKDDNTKLINELNKNKNIISNFENKVKENQNEINIAIILVFA